MKKLLVLLAVLSLAVSLGVYAEGQKDTKAAAPAEPVKLTWLIGVWSNQVDPKGYFTAEVKKATGVDLTLNYMPSAQLGQKIQVMVAGNDYPEMLMLHAGPNSLYQQWAGQGLFVELDKYLNEMPDLKKGFPEGETLKVCRVNGKLYMLPVLLPASRFNITYRKDWLDVLGLKVPKTIDEFYAVAKAFATDPDKDGSKNTYGFGMDKFGGTGASIVYAAFGVPTAPTGYFVDKGELQPAFMHPNFKAALALLKKSADEKILDPDSVTKIYAEVEKDFLQGKTGITLGNISSSGTLEGLLQQGNPKGTLVMGDPLVSPEGKQLWQFYNPAWRGNVITQKADSELKVRKAMEVFNWMVGKGDEFRRFGPEGVYWTSRGAHGQPMFTDAGLIAWGRQGEGYSEISLALRPFKSDSFVDSALWREEAKVKALMDAFAKYEPYAQYEPTIGLSTPTMVEQGATLVQIMTTGIFEVVVGGKPVDHIDTAIAEWRRKGGDQLLKELRAEYAKR